MVNYMDAEERIKKLEKDNKELKEIIAIALNKPLLKQLAKAIKEAEEGEYYTEEEFTKKHHLITA